MLPPIEQIKLFENDKIGVQNEFEVKLPMKSSEDKVSSPQNKTNFDYDDYLYRTSDTAFLSKKSKQEMLNQYFNSKKLLK